MGSPIGACFEYECPMLIRALVGDVLILYAGSPVPTGLMDWQVEQKLVFQYQCQQNINAIKCYDDHVLK